MDSTENKRQIPTTALSSTPSIVTPFLSKYIPSQYQLESKQNGEQSDGPQSSANQHNREKAAPSEEVKTEEPLKTTPTSETTEESSNSQQSFNDGPLSSKNNLGKSSNASMRQSHSLSVYHEYCYRHNPEITCNRQADQAQMERIQSQLEKLSKSDQQAVNHVWSIFSASPPVHRDLIIQGILSQCCFPQLSKISQEVNRLIKIDFLSVLPVELALKVLCYLDCVSLCKAAQVSRKWRQMADDDRVWHHMCEQHIDRKCEKCGWGLPLMQMARLRQYKARIDEKRKFEQAKLEEEQQAKRKLEEVEEMGKSELECKRQKVGDGKKETCEVVTLFKDVEPKTRPWKDVYSERFKVERNWRKGHYKLHEFHGHRDGIICLKFNHEYLISGSYDCTAKVWDMKTGECIRTLTGHTRGIRALVFDDQKLITGSMDGTLKVWNYYTGACVATYRGHTDGVLSVDCDKKRKLIVSGAADHTIKLWNVENRQCFTLRGHTGWVNSVKLHRGSNTLFSGSDDTSIRIWDLETKQCIKVLSGGDAMGHLGQVQQVIPMNIENLGGDMPEEDHTNGDSEEDDNGSQRSRRRRLSSISYSECNNLTQRPSHIISSSLDNTIKIWDTETGKCVRTLFGHVEGVWDISADNFRIVSGAHDRMVKVWDLESGKCMHTYGHSEGPVSCVALDDSGFASGGDDGVVRFYAFDEF